MMHMICCHCGILGSETNCLRASNGNLQSLQTYRSVIMLALSVCYGLINWCKGLSALTMARSIFCVYVLTWYPHTLHDRFAYFFGYDQFGHGYVNFALLTHVNKSAHRQASTGSSTRNLHFIICKRCCLSPETIHSPFHQPQCVHNYSRVLLYMLMSL